MAASSAADLLRVLQLIAHLTSPGDDALPLQPDIFAHLGTQSLFHSYRLLDINQPLIDRRRHRHVDTDTDTDTDPEPDT